MNTIKKKLYQLIHGSDRPAERQRFSIKATSLIDYMRPPPTTEWSYEEWAEGFTKNCPVGFPTDDPFAFRDEDGDLALDLPFAEMYLLSGARHFRGALALILTGEICYGPTIGSQACLDAALDKFRPLVLDGQLPPAALLHEFLEVDGSPTDWLADHIAGMELGRDYLYLPDDATVAHAPCVDEDVGSIRLSLVMAAALASTTPTLRGRKMRACLVEPGVSPLDRAANDPALLELLFSPPTRGLA